MIGHEVGLLDTSVVVSLGGITDSAHLPSRCFVSAITLAELSLGPLVARNDADRIARQSVLQQVEADFDPIPFDAAAARAFGRVAAQLRALGRKTSARAYDVLIAATAVAHGSRSTPSTRTTSPASTPSRSSWSATPPSPEVAGTNPAPLRGRELSGLVTPVNRFRRLSRALGSAAG